MSAQGRRNPVQVFGSPELKVFGQPASDDAVPLRSPEAKPLAVPAAVAAWMLNISRTTLWTLVNLPKKDPRRIKRTSYNTYPVVELQRHIAAELEEA